jgi:hypothetical protein
MLLKGDLAVKNQSGNHDRLSRNRRWTLTPKIEACL